MAIIKCKMCGGDLEITEGSSVAECEYCGSKQTLPALRNENVSALFNRANVLRMKSEFDKAEEIYEKILQMDGREAEAYWGLILCRYGVEYVEDPKTMERIPTCHRASYEAITADEDYKSALRCADALQREVYETEAKRIDAIQKGILDISKKEKPYDVFICYKETDENGKRTVDSTIGNDIYYQLTQEGFKVFFAAITLEDKLGQEYEPYIFSALNSAKVMLVLGTKPEYFTAVWVKNEWSRFMKMMKSDRSKLLIPCYRDMDAYELPEDFAHLQAQDMSKIGFINDVVRGIKKVIVKDEPKPEVRETVVVQQGTSDGPNTAALLKRAFMFLEDGDWRSAREYCEKVLDINPECAEAYLGKLLLEQKTRTQAGLKNCPEPFDQNSNYQKILRFGDKALVDELKGDIAFIQKRNENRRRDTTYNDAANAMRSAKTEDQFKAAAAKFKTIPGFKDADQLAKQCIETAENCRKEAEEHRKETVYSEASSLAEKGDIPSIEQAIEKFGTLSGWKDADQQIEKCREKIEDIKAQEETAKREAEERRAAAVTAKKKKRRVIAITIPAAIACIAFVILLITVIIPNRKYDAAMELMIAERYDEAIEAFEALDGYDYSYYYIYECKYSQAVELKENGHFTEAIDAFEALGNDTKAVEAFTGAGNIDDRNEQIEACQKELDYSAAVILMDEKKYAEALQIFEELDGHRDSVERITAIKEIMYNKAVSLADSGNYMDAIYAFELANGYQDANDRLRNLFSARHHTIDAKLNYTVGLKSDGTVVAVGENSGGQCDVSTWRDIVDVAAGYRHTVGLKSNGTVVATKFSGKTYSGDKHYYGEGDVTGWTDIVAIAAGAYHTVGLKSNGTVVATKFIDDPDNYVKYQGQCDVENWTDIVAIAAGYDYTLGLKADGTVVAVGNESLNRIDTKGLSDIVAVSAIQSHAAGVLKANGQLSITGSMKVWWKECLDWHNIVEIGMGVDHAVALKTDGTLLTTGYQGYNEKDDYGQCDVGEWDNIVDVVTGFRHTVGLRSDGTAIAVGNNNFGQCDVSDWTDIKLPYDVK